MRATSFALTLLPLLASCNDPAAEGEAWQRVNAAVVDVVCANDREAQALALSTLTEEIERFPGELHEDLIQSAAEGADCF